MKHEIKNIDAEIPQGEGNVILKKWHHHAPLFGICGGGSKIIKEYIKGMGFRYNGVARAWEKIDLFDNEAIEYLTERLTEAGYTVIDRT